MKTCFDVKEAKGKIDSYNFVPKDKKGFTSEAMFAMQLEANWVGRIKI